MSENTFTKEELAPSESEPDEKALAEVEISEEATASQEREPDAQSDAEPDAGDQPAQKAAPRNKGISERFAKLTQALHAERMEKERLTAELDAVKQAPDLGTPPSVDDFQTYEEYLDARADYRVAKALTEERSKTAQESAKQATARAQAEIEAQWAERQESARQKYADFDAVAYVDSLPVTEAMADSIRASEIGGDVIYHLGKHPGEAAGIAALRSKAEQAMAIGRLEEKLRQQASAPPPRSAAPPVPDQVRTSTEGASNSGLSDKASMDTWARNFQARRHR